MGVTRLYGLKMTKNSAKSHYIKLDVFVGQIPKAVQDACKLVKDALVYWKIV